MSLQEGTRLGRFEIVTLLGAGGMGEVYRARDSRLGREVAIKILPAAFSGDAERLWRFEREARAVASLNHPFICTVHDIGEHEGHRYLVMEMMEGEPLAERLQAGPIPMPLLLDLAVQMADALDAAHGAGVIHRDLKPANIFVTKRGEAKLLDFGLAKLSDTTDATSPPDDRTLAPADRSHAQTLDHSAGATMTGSVLGTAAYMSPEQARGETADQQSDLFSFGLVLYEMAAGKPAFSGNTLPVLFDAILNRNPPPLDEISHAPAGFSAVVSKAIEKDRDLRYRSAADLRADLKRLRRDATAQSAILPTASTSATQMPAVPASAVRRRSGLLLTSLGVAALVLAGATVYWLATRRGADQQAADLPLDRLRVSQLTSTGNASRPTISRDGKYIVYLQAEGESGTSVWLRQTGATNSVRILDGEPGRTVVGTTIGPDSTFVDVVRGGALWRVPFLGGTPRAVVESILLPPGWSPDGRQMAYLRASPTGRGFDLVVSGSDGANPRVLATREAPAGFVVTIPGATAVAPAWSPDGRAVAVVQRLGEDVRDMGAAVFDVSSGSSTVVRFTGDVPLGLAWLNSATLLVVQALEQGAPSQVWRVTVPDGRRLRLTNDVSRYSELSLTADANTFVTSRPEVRVSVWTGDAQGTGHEVLTPTPFQSSAWLYATVAWDQSRVLFTHTLNGRFEIFRTDDAAAGSRDALVAGRDFGAGPAGDLVYRTVSGDDVGLWKADRSGQHPVQLAKGSVNFPMVTPDGRDVVYSSSASGSQSVWRVPLAGGPPAQLVTNTIGIGGYSDVSQDGKSIALVLDGRWTVCDYPACLERRPIAVKGGMPRWMPDGRGLSYVVQAEQGANLWVQPLDGSAPRPITHFDDGRTIGHYAWSRATGRVAMSRVSFSSDIVLFTGLTAAP